MSDKKSKWLIFLVIVLLILQALTLGRLSDMRQEMNDLRSQVVNSDHDLRNTVANISGDIRRQLEAGASIIDSYDYEVGSLDPDDMTMAVSFSATPKQLAADTTATLELNGQSYPMQRQGNGFTASMDLDLFGGFRQPRVIFETLGLRQQETIDIGLNLRYDALPELGAQLVRGGGSTILKANEDGGGSYYLSGTIQIDIVDKTNMGRQVSLFDLCLIVAAEGRELWRLEQKDFPDSNISGSRSNGQCFFMDMDEAVEFPLQPGQTLSVYAQAEDEYGLIHQVIIDQISLDENGEPDHDLDWFPGEEALLDKEGNILWQPQYD